MKLNNLTLNILAFLFGAISVFAFAPFNFYTVIIISLAGLLFCAYKSQSGFKIGFLYGLGFWGIQIYWLFYSIYYIIQAGGLIATLTMILATAYLALYPSLTIWSYKKYKTPYEFFNMVFLFPSIWVLWEWLRGWFFLNGYPWSDIGYTQVNNFIMHGYFRVIGIYGVSWLVISIIAALFYVIYKRKYKLFLISYIVLICAVGALISYIKYTSTNNQVTKVALIQPNISGNEKWVHRDNLDIFTAAVKDTKADIIFLPETGIADFEANLPKGYLANLAKLAESNNAELFVGLPLVINAHNDYVNAALLITESNRPYYAKSHLVPYGEYVPLKSTLNWLYNTIQLPMVGFSPGLEDQRPINVSNQKLAFNLCYENGFANEIIRQSRDATLLVNLSDMVWFGNTIAMNQHLQLSQARAIENQRYFIQETNTSITAIINPDGKIVGQLEPFTRGILKGNVEGMQGSTPYQIVGNYPIIILCFLICLVAVFRRYTK